MTGSDGLTFNFLKVVSVDYLALALRVADVLLSNVVHLIHLADFEVVEVADNSVNCLFVHTDSLFKDVKSSRYDVELTDNFFESLC